MIAFSGRPHSSLLKRLKIPWKILGTMPYSEAAKIENDVLKNKKKLSSGSNSYTWSEKNYRGGTIHIKHFFGFKTPFSIPKGHDAAYAQTYVYSPKKSDRRRMDKFQHNFNFRHSLWQNYFRSMESAKIL